MFIFLKICVEYGAGASHVAVERGSAGPDGRLRIGIPRRLEVAVSKRPGLIDRFTVRGCQL